MVCQFINGFKSPQTKFATHGSAGVTIICFVFWLTKYDVWASAFQMSLHRSQIPISPSKRNYFFCLLSYEMEEDAAEVGESKMDITPVFEGWKANKRVTGEESKCNHLFLKVFFLYICHGILVQCLNDRGRQTDEEQKLQWFFARIEQTLSWNEDEVGCVLTKKMISQYFLEFCCS